MDGRGHLALTKDPISPFHNLLVREKAHTSKTNTDIQVAEITIKCVKPNIVSLTC